MVSRRGVHGSKGVLLLLAFCAAVCLPAMAENVFVTQIHGSYSGQFSADTGLIEYCGYNGWLAIDTQASGYTDDFDLTAGGDFSGTHDVSAHNLDRAVNVAGGATVDALTQATAPATASGSGTTIPPSGTTIQLHFDGSWANITERIDFDNPTDPPGVGIGIGVDAEYAWLRVSFDASLGAIHSLITTYGLSTGQATSLYNAGILGLIAQLRGFGYTGQQVVDLALRQGMEYLRHLLSTLAGPYVPGPIDQAAAKFGISWAHARDIYDHFTVTAFLSALGSAEDYAAFIGRLKGWGVVTPSGGLLDRTRAVAGETIHAAFRLIDPNTNSQLRDGSIAPYAYVARVLPDGSLDSLADTWGYMPLSYDAKTGTYSLAIPTTHANEGLPAGHYLVFFVLRNPANDVFSQLTATFQLT